MSEAQDQALQELGAYIALKQPDAVIGHAVAFGELTLSVTAASLPTLVRVLKADEPCRFSSWGAITALDHPEQRARVEEFLSARELVRQAQLARRARSGVMRQARHRLGHALVHAGPWLEGEGRAPPGQTPSGAGR